MAVQVEVRKDGLYRVQDVFDGKQHISKVMRDWHVLFVDDARMKRLGYVLRVDAAHQQVQVVDEVVHRNPSAFNAEVEVIDFIRVLEASNGYSRPMREVFTERRKSRRQVWVLEETSTTGFIMMATGIRLYVEKRDEVWHVR